MAISFNEMPSDNRVPGFFAEIDNSRALSGIAGLQYRILVVGQRLSAGTIAQGTPTLVSSKAQAVEYFGRGSNLAHMFDSLFDNNSTIEKWAIALNDNGAGNEAEGTLTVTGPATEDGTISLYVAGKLVEIAVESGDAQNDIAANIDTAINDDLDLPVTSVVANNVVTVTARHKGLIGNDIDMRLNYYGLPNGEKTPAGVSIAIVQLTGGTSNPDVATAISAMPDEIFNYILQPYTDSTNLTKWKNELDSRWGPIRMLEGHLLTAKADTVANLSTFGNSHNNQHVSVIDAADNSPTPAYLWASAFAGKVAGAASIDPARPFNTLRLTNILPPPPEDRRTYSERNTLLYDGIATHKVDKSGQVMIERVITTYQLNTADVLDASYLDANTLFTLSFYRQTARAMVTSKFPRHKLADDGTRFGAGQAIVTPSIMKGHLIALAGQWEELGLMEDMESFKANLIVERNAQDKTRLDVMLPPNIVNPLHMVATQISFIL